MQNLKKELIEIGLASIDRTFHFPFPLKSIGMYKNTIASGRFYEDKLEVTIRLSSTGETSTDIINDKSYTCSYPNVVVKIPGQRHYYAVPDPRDSFYFTYNLELADSIKKVGLFPKPPIWEINLSGKIKELIRELTELMNHSYEKYTVDRMDLLAFQLWEELLVMRVQQVKKDDFIESRINKIASYFQINFNQAIDIDNLIIKNGFSRRSFFRHWKHYFDLSPKLYLQDLKLQEAQRLLLQTDMGISEISLYLNFNDCAYFCSLFKSRYGNTPLQYRKSKV